jgi:hypothetical protein
MIKILTSRIKTFANEATKNKFVKDQNTISQGDSRAKGFWKILKYVIRRNLGLTAIIAAALLLEITSSVIF